MSKKNFENNICMKFKKAIEKYTDRKVLRLEYVEDTEVPNTFAIKTFHKEKNKNLILSGCL